MKDMKNIQNAVDNMLKPENQNSQILGPDGNKINGEPSQMEMFAMILQNLEMGLVQLSQNQQNMGMAIDASRLTIQMFLGILIEKELITKEEVETRYNTEVKAKMVEMQENLKKEIMKQRDQQENAQAPQETPINTCNDKDIVTEKEIGEDVIRDSEVLLASEREDEITKFPSE